MQGIPTFDIYINVVGSARNAFMESLGAHKHLDGRFIRTDAQGVPMDAFVLSVRDDNDVNVTIHACERNDEPSHWRGGDRSHLCAVLAADRLWLVAGVHVTAGDLPSAIYAHVCNDGSAIGHVRRGSRMLALIIYRMETERYHAGLREEIMQDTYHQRAAAMLGRIARTPSHNTRALLALANELSLCTDMTPRGAFIQVFGLAGCPMDDLRHWNIERDGRIECAQKAWEHAIAWPAAATSPSAQDAPAMAVEPAETTAAPEPAAAATTPESAAPATTPESAAPAAAATPARTLTVDIGAPPPEHLLSYVRTMHELGAVNMTVADGKLTAHFV